jgi:hypothetical protein
MELMEADDSFDGEGWLGEVTPRKDTPQPEQKKASLQWIRAVKRTEHD